MLNPIELIKNKQPKFIKVRLQRYYRNHDEPRDNPLHDSSRNDETALVENSPIMRQRFRDIARKIRVIKVNKNK